MFKVPESGAYQLRVTDRQFGGSDNHYYRIRVGAFESIERIRPLGVSVGSRRHPQAPESNHSNNPRTISVFGPNLGAEARVELDVPRETAAGTNFPIVFCAADGARIETGFQVVAADGEQILEAEDRSQADTPAHAIPAAAPGE